MINKQLIYLLFTSQTSQFSDDQVIDDQVINKQLIYLLFTSQTSQFSDDQVINKQLIYLLFTSQTSQAIRRRQFSADTAIHCSNRVFLFQLSKPPPPCTTTTTTTTTTAITEARANPPLITSQALTKQTRPHGDTGNNTIFLSVLSGQ